MESIKIWCLNSQILFILGGDIDIQSHQLSDYVKMCQVQSKSNLFLWYKGKFYLLVIGQ